MASNHSYINHASALLEDGQFWLPPLFLADDLPSPDDSPFPLLFGRTSTLCSPRDSLLVSSEDNSDEEDFFADLTRKVAQSTLVDGFPPRRASSKGLYPSGSPKSTLCCGCGCGHGSVWGNAGGVAQLKSAPPPTADLLYQAAGKVATMRLNQQRQQIQRAQYLLLQQQQHRQRLNQLIHLSDSKAEVSSHPCQAPSPQQRSAFQPPKSTSNGADKYGSNASLLSSSSAWPTLQQARQPTREPLNAGPKAMRAVLPRGSSGTGVFLPRQSAVTPNPEPKRKQGHPTVVIPAKVVQALNINIDGARSLGLRSSSPLEGQEFSLPKEWTY